MGLKVYDLPPGGLENNAIATPSNDVTFTWTYDQEELDKTQPLPKDIQIIKKTEPDASEDEVITLAKQKRYRKTKTIEMRKQYEDFEKEGKLEELPLYNIFNPKFQPTPPPSENGMTIVMRPQVAVHMMKVEIPSKVIEVINSHIDDELIPNADDFSSNLVGQINRSEKSAQLNFPKDDAGNEVSNILGKLASSYMKKVTDEEYETDVDDMWTVHSYEGDYNPLHDHGSKTPIGLSCILYLKVPDQIAALPNPSEEFNGLNGASGATDGFTYFTWGTHGMRDTNMLRPATEEYVKPEVGTMIMFPSWLRHSVNPFFGEGERRTFSANINVMKKVSKNEETN
jgi:hypothetical protein